jgi:hypothetical protein
MVPTCAGKSLGLDPASYLAMKNAKRQQVAEQVQSPRWKPIQDWPYQQKHGGRLCGKCRCKEQSLF